MTRKDYELLARVIRSARSLAEIQDAGRDTFGAGDLETAGVDLLANMLIGALKADNEKFNRYTFRKAAGL